MLDKVMDWLGFGGHASLGHDHAHSHGGDHGHTHGVIDPTIASTERQTGRADVGKAGRDDRNRDFGTPAHGGGRRRCR